MIITLSVRDRIGVCANIAAVARKRLYSSSKRPSSGPYIWDLAPSVSAHPPLSRSPLARLSPRMDAANEQRSTRRSWRLRRSGHLRMCREDSKRGGGVEAVPHGTFARRHARNYFLRFGAAKCPRSRPLGRAAFFCAGIKPVPGRACRACSVNGSGSRGRARLSVVACQRYGVAKCFHMGETEGCGPRCRKPSRLRDLRPRRALELLTRFLFQVSSSPISSSFSIAKTAFTGAVCQSATGFLDHHASRSPRSPSSTRRMKSPLSPPSRHFSTPCLSSRRNSSHIPAKQASDCNISRCLQALRRMFAFGPKLSAGSSRGEDSTAAKAARLRPKRMYHQSLGSNT